MATLQTAAVILAAGRGTRMKSRTSKLLHPVLGRPVLSYPVAAALEAGVDRVVIVVSHQAEAIREALEAQFPGAPFRWATQAEPRGTGDAVLSAYEATEGMDRLLILSGDVPGTSVSTLRSLIDAADRTVSPLALVTAHLKDPTAYGRMVRDAQGRATSIVEERDATAEQKEISEVNVGIYAAGRAFAFEVLRTAGTDNAQNEVYLTDIVHAAAQAGQFPATVSSPEGVEVWGINNRVDLARVQAALRARIVEGHMLEGVTFDDPASVTVEPGVRIGADTVVRRGVRLSGDTVIGSGVTLDEGSIITNSSVGDESHVKPYCVVDDSEVGDKCAVGPFAHLRPGTKLSESVKIGNFVETKKAQIGVGSKASHLTYLGDCEIGSGCNIGAGTITCNYDGAAKHRTEMGDGVFIGSGTQLVAPVQLGDSAYVGAGSTVTEDVPEGSLAVARGRQRNIEGWVEKQAAKRREAGK